MTYQPTHDDLAKFSDNIINFAVLYGHKTLPLMDGSGKLSTAATAILLAFVTMSYSIKIARESSPACSDNASLLEVTHKKMNSTEIRNRMKVMFDTLARAACQEAGFTIETISGEMPDN